MKRKAIHRLRGRSSSLNSAARSRWRSRSQCFHTRRTPKSLVVWRSSLDSRDSSIWVLQPIAVGMARTSGWRKWTSCTWWKGRRSTRRARRTCCREKPYMRTSGDHSRRQRKTRMDGPISAKCANRCQNLLLLRLRHRFSHSLLQKSRRSI
jgi:hypothetical protein